MNVGAPNRETPEFQLAASGPRPRVGRFIERSLIALLAAALVIVSVFAARTARRLRDVEQTDWAALGRLPDWGGLWVPDRRDPTHPFGTGDPPWNAQAARQIDALKAAEKAGRPHNVYIDCLPEGMPSFVIMTLNAVEFLFTPGRVTILGEFDGNRLRRIYTDGRPHPADPDLTFNGHSIGHWEGDTLVVDTVAILPQTFLPVGQAVALPNNGDMHIVERIRLTDHDALSFDLEITAPHQLAAPWRITRHFVRRPDRRAEIVEASCRQGDFASAQDAQGNFIFTPIAHEEGGAPLPFPR
jgi:hypothetical protein